MKKRVLLIDESLTVQKVVALTLDKSRYSVAYAKSRGEAIHLIREAPPNVVLVSDQVTDVTVGTFPKEVASWVGNLPRPAIILITSQEPRDAQAYDGVLKKPFSPQALQSIVTEHTQVDPVHMPPAAPVRAPVPDDEANLQSRFHQTFNDEAELVRETFRTEIENEAETLLNIPSPPAPGAPRGPQPGWQPAPPPAAPPSAAPSPTPPAGWGSGNDNLWAAPPPPAPAGRAPAAPVNHGNPAPAPGGPPAAVPAAPGGTAGEPSKAPGFMGAEDSMAYKAELRNQVEKRLEVENLSEVVKEVLEKIVPPIVERLVQERLDKLLQDEEDFVELK